GDGFEETSWSKALAMVAAKFSEVKQRGGKFGVIGSNHTTNEENYYLQKLVRQGLGSHNIDHHRTGDVAGLIGALAGKTDGLATTKDLYESEAVLVVGADLSQQHPFLAWQIRANWRHHGSRTYVVTPGPVREDGFAARCLRAAEGEELEALESLREALKAEPRLVVVFGDSIKGEQLRQLVQFSDSLSIPVKYVSLVDYSNSRGAIDMGLTPELLPGYKPASQSGLTLPEILAADDLDAVWVVGANPLKSATLASKDASVVVQDLFLTETAKSADVVLPAASVYEKSGTVTNVCGEVQRLKKALNVMGAKPDLEIFGLIAKQMKIDLGLCRPDKIFEEIRAEVGGYNVPLPVLVTGGASPTCPVNGRVPPETSSELIRSARDTLYTSGTLSRFSKTLNAVIEAPGGLYGTSRAATERERTSE
ncbi:MAG: molybdopterin-dependent oxidoreductase, partial [bacterium]|nr:molybdopterin-dependent oxidoreductase [bacterium]